MRKTRRFITWLLAAAVAVGWVVYINQSPEISQYVCALPGLGEPFEGYTIVQVSDAHGIVLGRGNRRLLAAVADQNPDAIAVTGDLVDSAAQLEDAENLIRGLCAIAPVFYVTGNHEWAAGLALEVKHMIQACGGTVLSNDYVMVKKDGRSLVIAGCDDPNGYADQKSPQTLLGEIEADHPGTPVVLLYHRNQKLETLQGADLVLCGHGHGSPINLHGSRPGVEKYRSGLYKTGDTAVCVSRGLGHSIMPFRLIRIHLPVVILETN